MRARLITFIVAVSIFMLSGCSKKDYPGGYIPTDSLGIINKWVLDSMKRYYYWNSSINTSPDYSLNTASFFASLLSVADRFSWISDGSSLQPASNSYFIYGFHYALLQLPAGAGYLGVVTDVSIGSAAANAGFKRGTYFTRVNSEAINSSNLNAITHILKSRLPITLTLADYNGGAVLEGKEINLAPGFAGENAIQYTRTYSANGIVTGYLNYRSFAENNDGQLIQAITKLKAANINELILDLRYNAGGSVASSAKMVALVANSLTANDVYAIYQGNAQEGMHTNTLQQVLNTSGNTSGRQYSTLQSAALSLKRIFILTTGGTTSAAELVVNNTKPYLPVIQIGAATGGKNEASFLIQDQRVPREVYWTMEPTVYKLFNKNKEGNYETGLAPDYAIDELAFLPLADVGAVSDPLIAKAFSLIYGSGPYPAGYANLRQQTQIAVTPVYRSAEEEALRQPARITNR
ncbi:hypothetical protein A4D02_32810 [Niastella koreensis]|uniref:Peptidase S41 n=2 Tax=Niastella koreensis TaxID=354356 RepID=G8T7H0_NIAKG|nr:S41 family peptidase [Niastella koreensis]AEW01206.1 peptidase S41 [Niastella koreensis GR20-10]OQP45974.1 hypothetical protein A4D02_32810 [Niastella koreensis]